VQSHQWQQSCSMGQTNGWTYMTKLTVAFRNFPNAPKIWEKEESISIHSVITSQFWRLQCKYEDCPESIRSYWISRKPIAWSWCNLAASHKRPYCVSVNSRSSVGLVIRQWDAIDWACVKSQKSQGTKSGLKVGRGADRSGWCDVLPKKPTREL